MTPRLRVLVLTPGPIEGRVNGPAIRGWETARAFAGAGHHVTVAAFVPEAYVRDGIQVVPHIRRRIVAELRRSDVVHGPMLPPYAVAMMSVRSCLGVADLYDPVDLELELAAGRSLHREKSLHLAGRRIHLRWSDIVICANDRQLDRTRNDLAGISRPGAPPELMVVPMGLSDPPPRSDGRPLRNLIPAIGADDPVILWWGNIWRWLDAATAIEAVARLATRRPDVRLVITAGRPADASTDRLNSTREARELACARGVLDRNVFFLEEWIPYEDRHRYLHDADVGLTLHRESAEAVLAARFRYMDYVWASRPSVLAAGDDFADQLSAVGAARLVPPEDPKATADALESLLTDKAALAAAGRACETLAERYRWSQLLAPLVARVEELAPARRSPGHAARAAGDAARYYTQRIVDYCSAAFSS